MNLYLCYSAILTILIKLTRERPRARCLELSRLRGRGRREKRPAPRARRPGRGGLLVSGRPAAPAWQLREAGAAGSRAPPSPGGGGAPLGLRGALAAPAAAASARQPPPRERRSRRRSRSAPRAACCSRWLHCTRASLDVKSSRTCDASATRFLALFSALKFSQKDFLSVPPPPFPEILHYELEVGVTPLYCKHSAFLPKTHNTG